MKRVISLFFTAVLMLCLMADAFAQDGTLYSRQSGYSYDEAISRVIDEASILTDNEESQLQEKIEFILSEYSFDVVILTVNTIGSKTAEAFADDYYDYNNYGYGENADGLLFMLNMGERDYYTSTCGKGIEIFTDYGIEYISNRVVEKLTIGDYFEAFSEYLELVERFLRDEKSGKPVYDVYSQFRENVFDIGAKGFVACLLIGFFVSLIIVKAMKSKMNTAKVNESARAYIEPNSFKLTKSEDTFLFRTTMRVKVQNTQGSGGSRTHTGSSGRSHGGGGGKF
ncbi:MAG: hypothetical protein BWY46_01285 [Firmicutes bacterium ADurb.Bin300]|nr:MAG: hypothetical protein BWY46_01285 [Firmicutes bacterium ADurb.Bin300]